MCALAVFQNKFGKLRILPEVCRLSLAMFPVSALRLLALFSLEQGQLEGALVGMDLVGSCLAIWNIASFERSCAQLMHDFHVEEKFISVKVLSVRLMIALDS